MRSKIPRLAWGCFVCMVVLASCVPMGRIQVQVPVPPTRALPDDIQSIALMNRSMTTAFTNLDKDTLENYFVKKRLHVDETMQDSLAADSALKVLANLLFESGRYDVVIPVKRNLPNDSLSVTASPAPLTLSQVRQICTEFKTDALLTLENFDEKLTTSYRMDATNYFMEGSMISNVSAFIQLAFHSTWKLYQPKEKLLAAKFEVRDTIFWEGSGRSVQEAYEKLPLLKETLFSGASENARNFALYISPGWKEDKRSYFITNDKSADEAINFLQKNKWKEAEETWKKFADSPSATFRSRIEFNLALAAEMNGDLNQAIEWATKSYNSHYTVAVEEYIRVLRRQLGKN